MSVRINKFVTAHAELAQKYLLKGRGRYCQPPANAAESDVGVAIDLFIVHQALEAQIS